MSPHFAKAYLEITNLCNLSCRFCHGTKRQGEFMPTERFAKLAEALRPYTDYLYLHVLGEPLLHPELPEILAVAASLGFRICITTNGTLLGEREGLLLSFAPHIHKISVSLHASESNGCKVGDNYLENCLSFAKKASEAGIIVALRLWNLEGNAKTPSENKENAAILSALSAAFADPWQDTRNGKKLKERVYLEWGETFDWPDMGAPDYGETCFCYGLRDQLGILVDGTVVPCCLDAEGNIPLGNLLQTPLAEILESPRALALKKGFDERRATEPLCRHCGYARRF